MIRWSERRGRPLIRRVKAWLLEINGEQLTSYQAQKKGAA
jgi:hypothetical protein